jgi:polyferredoxin
MDQVGKPKGLIRYDSELGIQIGKKLSITPRMIGYSIVLLALVVGLGFGIGSRSNSEITILRAPGMLFQEVGKDSISNLYNFKVVNKTRDELDVFIALADNLGNIKHIGAHQDTLLIPRDGMAEGTFFVVMHRKDITGRKNKIKFNVISDGKVLESYTTNFLGPVK